MRGEHRRLAGWVGVVVLLVAGGACTRPPVPRAQPLSSRVTWQGDWLYVSGERFLVKGIGYSPYRPHQLPWKSHVDPAVIEQDFQRITEAGFNTLRTWAPLQPHELALAKRHGLMVIQGIFPSQAYGTTAYLDESKARLKAQAELLREHDNILMFLIGNEPSVERIYASGTDGPAAFFQHLREAIDSLQIPRPISFANWPQLDFLDHGLWDVVAFNVYPYSPVTVSHALGYQEYVRWLKRRHAAGKPLIITEFGLSVSPQEGRSAGYGGNTEDQQRVGVISQWDGLLAAGASGGCLFEWNDEWWKNFDYAADADFHDPNDPEEWFGMVGIPTAEEAPLGVARPLYDAVAHYNQAITVSPKPMESYVGVVPLEVYATPRVSTVRYRLDSGAWQELPRTSAHWWTGTWDSTQTADGGHLLEVEAGYEGSHLPVTTAVRFWVRNAGGLAMPPRTVEIRTDEASYLVAGRSKEIELVIAVTDAEGKPVVGEIVQYAIFEPRFSAELARAKATGEDGTVRTSYLVREPGFVTVSAGVAYADQEFRRTFGQVRTIEVKDVSEPVAASSQGFVLFDPGTERIVDYEQYGTFLGAGTDQYAYQIRDAEGLSAAVGEGIYPNGSSVYKDPAYRQFSKDGALKGHHWDFLVQDGKTFHVNFLKWATTGEEPGVKQFFTALMLERAGLIEHAVKAYYATVVHYPTSVGWTYWQTPWYVGKVAWDKLNYLLREHPSLRMRLEGASIVVEGGYDTDVKNDRFIIDPGRIVPVPAGEEAPIVDLRGEPVARTVGEGRVRLVRYKNGHWQLVVDDHPYVIRGVSYEADRVGETPDEGTRKDWMQQDENGNGRPDGPYDAWVDVNRNNLHDPDEPVVGDFQLLREMGANTIRVYHHASNKPLLRDLYERYGIRTLMGDFVGMYTVGSGASWEEGTDYLDPVQRENMRRSVREMVTEHKDEPYVLMWVLGNENNYGGVHGNVGGWTNAPQHPDVYYAFVNELAQMIHEMDPDHPVAMANGDQLFFDLLVKACPDVDVFGCNSYRGWHGFGQSLWTSVRALADRPVLITEFGCPAYHEGMTREVAEAEQAAYHRGCWRDIAANVGGRGIGNAIGGVVFQWLDGWWKAGQPPRFSPSVHETQPGWAGPFPSGWSYEEWYGLMGQGDGSQSPFLRQPRAVYTVYRDELWKP